MVEDRIAALERRLQKLEDEQEIVQLLTSYGPLVDSGQAEEIAAIWEPDGVYDNDEVTMVGHDQLAAMVGSRRHQGWIEGGCCHFNGPVKVTLGANAGGPGDTAIAVTHSLMVVHQDDTFVIRRATANHWQLRRGAEGWRVTVRTGRILDGREEAPALLAAGALAQLPALA